MGGYMSSCSSSTNSSTEIVRVIGFGGMDKLLDKPVKAAEIMMENPNHFLCRSWGVKAGKRGLTAAVGADEELESGNVYILLPMSKLHSSISASEYALLHAALSPRTTSSKNKSDVVHSIVCAFCGICRVLSHRRKHALVTPALSSTSTSSATSGEDVNVGDVKYETNLLEGVDEEELGMILGMIPQRRVSFCKSRLWKPALETINESPRCV